MNDIRQLQNCGYDIICNRTPTNRYFIGERIFEIPELKILIKAVEAAYFIPQNKSELLVKKLTGFASKYDAEYLMSNTFINQKIKSTNSKIYYNIDCISQAINIKKKLVFIYLTYLVSKEKIIEKQEKQYILFPQNIIWYCDNLYLIGYEKNLNKNFMFRIDRIVSLRINDEENNQIICDCEIDTYPKTDYFIFSDNFIKVKLECEKSTMDNIIDKFGENIEISIDTNVDDEKIFVFVNVEISAAFYSWIFNHKGMIKIVEPKIVKEGFLEMLNEQIKNY